MLNHPTIDQLRALKLDGMADAFVELQSQDAARDLAPAEWLALLLDRETANRGTQRFKSRLRNAKLRHDQASIEDVDYRSAAQTRQSAVPATGDQPLDRRANAICSSPGRAASASRGSVARWRRKPAATATPCITRGRRACSPISNSRTATAASHVCSARSPRPIC